MRRIEARFHGPLIVKIMEHHKSVFQPRLDANWHMSADKGISEVDQILFVEFTNKYLHENKVDYYRKSILRGVSDFETFRLYIGCFQCSRAIPAKRHLGSPGKETWEVQFFAVLQKNWVGLDVPLGTSYNGRWLVYLLQAWESLVFNALST